MSQNNQISSLPVFRSFQFRPRKQIHLRQRKQIHLRPWKEYLAIQLHPRKVYFAIQFPPTEEKSLTSTDRSQMNCASSPDTADSSDSSSDRVVGSNYHSLSIADFASHTKKRLKQPMQTYSKVLVNSQEILTS